MGAEQRQRWRSEVLGTTKEDLRDFGTRLSTMTDSVDVLAFGSKEAFTDANAKLDSDGQLGIIEAHRSEMFLLAYAYVMFLFFAPPFVASRQARPGGRSGRPWAFQKMNFRRLQ